MTEYIEDTICKQEKIAISVMLNTVKIEFTCSDAYEAQVLFDDMVERFRRGETISIEPCGPHEQGAPK